MDSEESRGEIDAEADVDIEAVGEVISNSENSAIDEEVSSNDDEFDDVIDTSTFKQKVPYPSVGNLTSNQTTPARKQGDGDEVKKP